MTPEFTAKFWTYWFLALCGVGLFAILVTHYDDIWEFIIEVFDAFRPGDPDESDDEKKHKKKRSSGVGQSAVSISGVGLWKEDYLISTASRSNA